MIDLADVCARATQRVNQRSTASWDPIFAAFCVLLSFLILSGCGGGNGKSEPTATYSVGGVVTGLIGNGLSVQLNGSSKISVSGNGGFEFPTSIENGSAYNLVVVSQPTGPSQTCTAANASGVISNSNVTNIAVTCVTNSYFVAGTVSGLTGGGLSLQQNGTATLSVSADGSFSFPVAVTDGASYNVTIFAQPANPTQSCSVTNPSGVIASANVNNININCVTNSYTLGGQVTGLVGAGLILQNGIGNNINVLVNGGFVFPVAVLSGSSYNITINSEPTQPSQTCVVANAAAIVGGSNVSNINVSCTTNTYAIGGIVNGLNGSGLVLQDNGGDDLRVGANGAFNFTTPLQSGSAYGVTVKTQPLNPAQRCSVMNGIGPVNSSNVVAVGITCVNIYSVGGAVTGLVGSGLILQNNSGDDLSISANGVFQFNTKLSPSQTYSVSIRNQPASPVQTCNVSNGSGTVGSADILNVSLVCETDHIAYVPNIGAVNLSAYTINSFTGALTAIPGSPFSVVGSRPIDITLDLMGRYAYVLNSDTYTISAYTVDGISGALNPVAGASYSTGANPPLSVSFDPTGHYLYVSVPFSNNIVGFQVNSTTGVLAPILGSPFSTGDRPTTFVFDPSGRFLYVANFNDNTVSGFILNSATGALSPMVGSPFSAGAGPRGITIDKSGSFAYVTNGRSNSISIFAVDPTSGSLTEISGSPVTVKNPGSNALCGIVVDPATRYVYASLSGGSQGYVSVLAIDASTHGLTEITDSPVPAGASGCAIAMAPSGEFLYVPNVNSANISGYLVNSISGSISALPGSPFPAGSPGTGPTGFVIH